MGIEPTPLSGVIVMLIAIPTENNAENALLDGRDHVAAKVLGKTVQAIVQAAEIMVGRQASGQVTVQAVEGCRQGSNRENQNFKSI
ncbi:hypothetical protein DSO57_1007083 [Entomophthora muscae]|uniref:Uncharacterized protein n=1 Tax=Entomophthora muscae TaxID=34485 RepID=A0ACC2RYK4_9FUNG|nr:hypothetical protein DSO57_1007083 [Entomophthora muscae]